MPNKYCLYTFLFILYLIFQPFVNPAQAREIVNDSVLSAHVKDSFRCGPFIDLTVNSPSLKYFAKDTSQLQQLIKAARNKLSTECGRIMGMKIRGIVNGARVYEAKSNEHEGWKLVSAYPDRFKYQSQIEMNSPESRTPRPVLFPEKIWNSQQRMSKERNDFIITLFNSTGPNAQPGEFRLVTNSRRRNGPRTNLSFTGNQYASCSELMAIRASAYTHLLDFDEFRKTHKGRDLPPEIIDGYYLMRDVLVGQCPSLKALRLSFESMSGDRTLKYTGTMTASSGWDILDGTVTTEYDSTREIQIKMRDPYNAAGIDYKGRCETSPVLPLKPIYYNKADKAFAKPLTLQDYKARTKAVAKFYLKECPGVKNIRFSLNPMPQSYICCDDGPCYLTWSVDKPEEIDSSQMKLKPMLNDYNDVILAFARADKKLLDEYKEFVRLFHNDWLEVYSEKCHAHIKDPKTFTVKTIETRYNQDGFEESSREVGATQRIDVASDYADRFDYFYGLNQTWGTLLLMNRIVNNGSGRASSRAFIRSVNYFIHNRDQLTIFMTDRCTSTEVQTIYENLDRYYTNKPLKTGDINDALSLPTGKALASKSPAATKTDPPPTETPVSDGSLKGAVDNQPKRLINSQESFKVNFPSELALSPLVNDFLLARYYPDQLRQRMLEAMLSSRWSYERSQKKPLGGRFFNPDSLPKYKDIQGLTKEFHEWLISRAEALPEEMIIEMPLQYGQNTMRVNNNCFKLIMPQNATVRILQAEKDKADRKLRQCEDRNRRLEQHFESCERARDDLEQARQKLARAKEGGCVQNNHDITGETDSNEGPCDFPSNLNMSNMKTEMMKCLKTACGTPSSTTDMLSYQKCAQAVSEQFRNAISRQMGQTPSPQTSQKKDTCQAAEKEIQTIEQLLAQYRCDLMPRKPELFDCASNGVAEQPDYMNVERIELSHMQNCIAEASAYNRRSKSSAELLPNAQPYSDTHFGFVLSVDKLALPYDLLVPSKGQWTTVNARIKVAVKAVDNRLNRRGQFGLTAEVKGLDFRE